MTNEVFAFGQARNLWRLITEENQTAKNDRTKPEDRFRSALGKDVLEEGNIVLEYIQAEHRQNDTENDQQFFCPAAQGTRDHNT